MPLGLTVTDGPLFEAVANGDAGPPLGRELEIAGLLKFIRDQRIRNVVFVTGDVHYCAAHHYDPARAAFTDFHPFWEFVAGPAHAGTFGPARLDKTFGPEVRFLGIPAGMKPNRPPSEGPAVLRDVEGGWPDEGADGEAEEPRRRHVVQRGAAATLDNSEWNAEVLP